MNRAYSDRVRTATATLTVEVVAPSGSVNLVPDTDPIIVTAGAPAVTSTIAINRTGFAGPVELTVREYEYSYQDGQYWPSGVTAIVSPGIATGATSTLSISAPANAVNGTYLLLIRGTGAGISDALATR